ncbi:MAG: DUF6263 family protein [Ignavibacteriaceae bacterium]|nr:DUF6263 family protein [Ignavibacteriaceae bacterium]
MKYLFLIIFTLSFFMVGCSKKEEKPIVNKSQFVTDTSGLKTTPLSNPNEPFTFRYNYEKGKSYNYRVSSIASDIETMKAESTITQTFKQNSIYNLELTPTETDQGGTMEMNAVINSIKIDAQVQGQSLSYQSGTVKDSTEKLKFAEYEALTKSAFSVRISKLGEILEIMRVDKILNKYFSINAQANAMNPEQKSALRMKFIEGLLRPIFVQIFKPIPDHSVAKDSIWTYTQAPAEAMVFKMDNTNVYKIINLEKLDNDKIAIIDGTIKTVITGNNKATDRGVSYDFTKPVLNASGKIYFDITKGVIIKSNVKTKTATHFTMEAPTPKGKQKGERWGTTENSYIAELL